MSPESGSSTLEFLRSIWPEGHTYCIAVKPPGKGAMRQAFFQSIEEAAAFAEIAALRSLEVYHACAVFKAAGSRKATNVAGAKIFWLDIDVGSNKPYADDRAALAGLFGFCQSVSLPAPTIVHSGGGWHAYWTLEETLPAQVWAPFAEALRAKCQQFGLHADHGITIDIARILRPVGTQNFKREKPAPVELRHSAPPISARVLAAALSAPVSSPFPTGLPPGVDNSKFLAQAVHNDEPSYASVVVSNCRQLAHMRDTGGRIDEPLWYANLCTLAHCEDGEQFAHEWSKGDERYAYADTAKKLEQARRAPGPTTCERFQQLNPAGCVGCPHFGRITAPIQLGRGSKDPPKQTIVNDIQVPVPPSPFKIGANGALLYPSRDPDTNEPTTLTVYKAPLFLETIREHEATGQTTLIIRHWLPQEGWQEAAVPWNDRSQKAVINALASQKVNIPRAQERYLLLYLELAIDNFQLYRKTAMEYAQFGWREDFTQFVLGSELYSVGAKEPEIIGTTKELTARTKQMRSYGTLEAWRGAVQPLFVHEQQGLMVVAGFASVLMRFVQELTGVIVAAVSPEPRLGKTMGLIAARSIWGDDNAIDIATNDTANSRFKMLAILNGLPATWDDMRKSNDPEIIKQFVLSFSQGRDKNRLDKYGELRSNSSGWASVLLATSNISIAELVGHDGETAQQARILEYRFLPMEGMKFSDGQNYERVMRQNRGTAGRKFIQALMIPGMVPWIQEAVPRFVREYETQLGRSDASFYASFLGCVKAAGLILNRVGILEFSVDRLIDFAVRSAEEMGRIMEENKIDPISILTKFINENWVNTLVVMDPWRPKVEATIRQLPRAKLFVRYEMNSERIYIDKGAFKEWCRPKNIMFRDIGERLRKKSILLNETRRMNLGAGTPLAGAGQIQCFEIDAGHPDLGNIRELQDANTLAVERPHAVVHGPGSRKRVLVPGKVLDAPQ